MKFSVIIPLYNGAKTIQSTLDTVVAQTYKDYEVILVNDGSPDNVGDLAREYMARHPGVCFKYIEQKNKGLGGARNTAIKNSTGEIIAIIDQDDLWYPDKMAKVAETYLKHPEVGIVGHNCYIRRGGSLKGAIVSGPSAPDMHRALLFGGNRLTTLTTAFKKQIVEDIGLFSEDVKNIHLVEDYDLWLRMALAGYKFYFLPDYLAEYVQHDNNYSLNQIERMRASEMYVLEQHYQRLQPKQRLDWLRMRRRRAQIWFSCGYHYIFRARSWGKGLTCWWRSFWFDPSVFAVFMLGGARKILRLLLIKGEKI
ncbi:glycosyltransferase family 2 protein [Candidatus Saganbacteria bacterium]|nr:glycosyltransferase family 2 protein [Candidatus Saganbacteria bacterium]